MFDPFVAHYTILGISNTGEVNLKRRGLVETAQSPEALAIRPDWAMVLRMGSMVGMVCFKLPKNVGNLPGQTLRGLSPKLKAETTILHLV